jgi:hypothetical protein
MAVRQVVAFSILGQALQIALETRDESLSNNAFSSVEREATMQDIINNPNEFKELCKANADRRAADLPPLMVKGWHVLQNNAGERQQQAEENVNQAQEGLKTLNETVATQGAQGKEE